MARFCFVRAALLWLVSVAALVLPALAQEAQDEVRMRDGTVVRGSVIEADRTTVIVRTADGPREFKRRDVQMILFGAPPAANGEFPPGFSVANGLNLKRVIALRRITNVRIADEGKGEPAFARISAKGARVAWWSPAAGLYSANFDGSNQTLVWAKGAAPQNDVNGNFLDLSADGRYVYWLNWWGDPMHRANSDGSGGQVMLSRKGANARPWRLRRAGQRLYFMDNQGIYSVDTAGDGDFREILSRAKFGALFDPVVYNGACPTDFDVSEDGSRVAFVAYVPKAEKLQLCTISGDGTNVRAQLVKTDGEPEWLHLAPDGSQMSFRFTNGEHSDGSIWTVNYDGTGLRQLPLPLCHGGLDPTYNRYSADSKRLVVNTGQDACGMVVSDADGSNWSDFASPHFSLASVLRSVLPWATPPHFDADLRRFVYVARNGGPAQVVSGEVNPPQVLGLPVIADLQFTRALSTNPAVPNHLGTIKARVTAGTGDVLRVCYCLLPRTVRTPEGGWDYGAGHYGMQGDKLLRDDGKGGDETAGDGVYSSNLFGPVANAQHLVGHHYLQVIAHDEAGATIVDVDGVDIR